MRQGWTRPTATFADPEPPGPRKQACLRGFADEPVAENRPVSIELPQLKSLKRRVRNLLARGVRVVEGAASTSVV